MTQRTFWIIVIKIFGIFLLIEAVVVIPQSISGLAYWGLSDNEGAVLSMIGGVLVLLMFIVILRLFVYKPEWLVNKLKLDKGFPDESIDFKIDKSSAITVATIILGGVLFIDGLPLFCKQVVVFYQEDAMSGRFGDKPSTQGLVLYGIKTVAGYMIVSNHVAFSKFVDKLNKAE